MALRKIQKEAGGEIKGKMPSPEKYAHPKKNTN
jgi:hypothetical protein